MPIQITRKGYFTVWKGLDQVSREGHSGNHTTQDEAEETVFAHAEANGPGVYRIHPPEVELDVAFVFIGGVGTNEDPPPPDINYSTPAVIQERNEQGVFTGNFVPSPSGVLVGFDPASVAGVTGWSASDTWEADASTIPANMTLTELAGGRVLIDATGVASGSYLLTANMNLSGNFASKPFTVVVP